MSTSMENRDLLMKLLESSARIETRMGHVEDLIKEQKGDVKALEARLTEVEASKNKMYGAVIVLSTIIGFIAPLLRKLIGE